MYNLKSALTVREMERNMKNEVYPGIKCPKITTESLERLINPFIYYVYYAVFFFCSLLIWRSGFVDILVLWSQQNMTALFKTWPARVTSPLFTPQRNRNCKLNALNEGVICIKLKLLTLLYHVPLNIPGHPGQNAVAYFILHKGSGTDGQLPKVHACGSHLTAHSQVSIAPGIISGQLCDRIRFLRWFYSTSLPYILHYCYFQ